MLAVPDPATFAILPWRPEEQGLVARMFCDMLASRAQAPTRATRARDHATGARSGHARSMGFDAYNIGPELEYFYFRSAKPENGVPEPLDEGGYFDLTTLDAGSTCAARRCWRSRRWASTSSTPTTRSALPARGRHALRRTRSKMADDCMTYRIVVKEYAHEIRLARHVHAEAAVRRERLGHARRTSAPVQRQVTNALSTTRTTRTSSRRRRRSRSSPASSSTRARSRRCSPSGSTPTSAWCRATRRRSTWPGARRNRSALDAGAALPPRQGGRDAGRAALP